MTMATLAPYAQAAPNVATKQHYGAGHNAEEAHFVRVFM
jgi:hypothetical protein